MHLALLGVNEEINKLHKLAPSIISRRCGGTVLR